MNQTQTADIKYAQLLVVWLCGKVRAIYAMIKSIKSSIAYGNLLTSPELAG